MVACYGFEKVELHYTQNLRILNNHYAFIKHAQVHLKSIHHENKLWWIWVQCIIHLNEITHSNFYSTLYDPACDDGVIKCNQVTAMIYDYLPMILIHLHTIHFRVEVSPIQGTNIFQAIILDMKSANARWR